MHYINVAVLEVKGGTDESVGWHYACPGLSLPPNTLTRDATPQRCSLSAALPGSMPDYACYWQLLLRVAKLLRVLKSRLYMSFEPIGGNATHTGLRGFPRGLSFHEVSEHPPRRSQQCARSGA
jgi:hypothetical protein